MSDNAEISPNKLCEMGSLSQVMKPMRADAAGGDGKLHEPTPPVTPTGIERISAA